MADSIEIPIDDLRDTLTMLEDIRQRIEEKTGLERVGSENDVGDRKLIKAIHDFDGAWKGGQERVQENVDAFKDATTGIIDNFTRTDDETTQNLE
ncbi:hypothetical protein [Streptomyces sp. NPDC002520]